VGRESMGGRAVMILQVITRFRPKRSRWFGNWKAWTARGWWCF